MRIYDHPVLDNIPAREKVYIVVDGKKIEAFKGEPVAAAMFAAGIKVHRTTRKYHEPRGVFCNRGRCTDCVMKVNGRPNVRTCVTKVQNGMVVETLKGAGKWA